MGFIPQKGLLSKIEAFSLRKKKTRKSFLQRAPAVLVQRPFLGVRDSVTSPF